jgi:hypothetical protein
MSCVRSVAVEGACRILRLFWEVYHLQHFTTPVGMCFKVLGEMISCMDRVGSILKTVTVGLRTSGREKPMVKDDIIQSMAMCSLAIFKTICDMEKAST